MEGGTQLLVPFNYLTIVTARYRAPFLTFRYAPPPRQYDYCRNPSHGSWPAVS